MVAVVKLLTQATFDFLYLKPLLRKMDLNSLYGALIRSLTEPMYYCYCKFMYQNVQQFEVTMFDIQE